MPALGMPNRATDLAAADADILLVTADADERTMQKIAGRADVALLVGRRKSTRLGQLASVVALLRAASPPVVVVSDPRAVPTTNMEGASAAPDPIPEQPTLTGAGVAAVVGVLAAGHTHARCRRSDRRPSAQRNLGAGPVARFRSCPGGTTGR